MIDYTKVDFTEDGQCYDIIYDTVGKSSFSKCKSSLTKKGVYMSPVLAFSLLVQMLRTSISGNKKAKFSATGMLPIADIQNFLQDAKEFLEIGGLKMIIDKSFTLGQIADAHRYIDLGHKKGNVVVSDLPNLASEV